MCPVRQATGPPAPQDRGDGPPGGQKPATLVVAGTNHRRAPVSVRGLLAGRAVEDRLAETLRRAAGAEGLMVLSTCNRVEVWAVAPPPPPALASVLERAAGAPRGCFEVLAGEAAALHAVRVTAGLDSIAWGEPQIAVQVGAALSRAKAEGKSNRALEEYVRAVVRAAARARSAAGLGPSSAGTADAAATLVKSKARGLQPAVLVIGTGAMGRLLAGRLSSFASVTVAGRDLRRAAAAAGPCAARAIRLEDALEGLARFDAVVLAVAAGETVLPAAALERAAAERRQPLLVLDLSVPCAVAEGAGALRGVETLTIDDLRDFKGAAPDPAKVRDAEAAARRFAGAAHRRIEGAAAERTVRALHERAAAVAREEAQHAWSHLTGDPARDRAVVEKLAERVARRLLHPPTQALRGAAGAAEASALEGAARALFALEEEGP